MLILHWSILQSNLFNTYYAAIVSVLSANQDINNSLIWWLFNFLLQWTHRSVSLLVECTRRWVWASWRSRWRGSGPGCPCKTWSYWLKPGSFASGPPAPTESWTRRLVEGKERGGRITKKCNGAALQHSWWISHPKINSQHNSLDAVIWCVFYHLISL